MNFKLVDDFKAAGFVGFGAIKDLFLDISSIPPIKGVYMVLYLDNKPPEFLRVGCGPSLYKKKTNPNVSLEELKRNWVDNTIVVYIGKAGGKNQKGLEGDATLKGRLKDYFSFGQGNDVWHYGGRYIWQLKSSRNLVICWKETPEQEPGDIESDLIQNFKNDYEQKRPFANLKD